MFEEEFVAEAVVSWCPGGCRQRRHQECGDGVCAISAVEAIAVGWNEGVIAVLLADVAVGV